MPKSINSLMDVLLTLFEIGLIFAPQIGYVSQYWSITAADNTAGYARLVSLILLVSYTLRIFYYFGHTYSLVLLAQAVVGVVAHFFMLWVVLRIDKAKKIRTEPTEPSVTNEPTGPAPILPPIDLHSDDHTPDGKPEVTEVLLFSARSSEEVVEPTRGGIMNFLLKVEASVESLVIDVTPLRFTVYYIVYVTLGAMLVAAYYGLMGLVWDSCSMLVGYAALGCEAMLVTPQIIKNARRRSTAGLDRFLVATWVVGDSIKVVYVTMTAQPLPFFICGILQLLLDAVVIGQLVYYPSNVATTVESTAPISDSL